MRVLVFPDFKIPLPPKNRLSAFYTLYSFLLLRSSRFLLWAAGFSFDAILAPSTLQSPLVRHPNKIRFYSEFYGECLRKLNFEEIHSAGDSLSSALKAQSLFCQNGLDYLSYSEGRWIPSLNDNLLIELSIVDLFLQQKKPTEIFLCSKQSDEICSALSSKFSIRHWLPGTIISLLRMPWQRFKEPKQFARIFSDFKRIRANLKETKELSKQAKKTLLVVGIMDRTLRRLETLLASEAWSRSEWNVTVVEHNLPSTERKKLLERLDNLGATVVPLVQFLSLKEIESLEDPRIEYQIDPSPFHLKTATWQGFELAPILEQFFLRQMESGFRLMQVFSKASLNALDQIQPEAVLHFEETDWNRAICFHSQGREIPNFSLYCLSPAAYGARSVRRSPDYLLSSGTFLRDEYISGGSWKLDHTRVVGDPAFDLLFQYQKAGTRTQLREKYNLPEEKRVAMILTTYAWGNITDELLTKTYRTALEAAEKAGHTVIIKAHPQQDLEALKLQFAEIGASSSLRFFQKEDLNELSCCSDVAVVIYFSTAIPLIAAAEIPFLVMVPDEQIPSLEQEFCAPSLQGSLFSPISSPNSFYEEFFRRVLEDRDYATQKIEAQLSYAVSHNGPLDGKSSERFWSALNELCEKNPRTQSN